jgi:hypothetical protein
MGSQVNDNSITVTAIEFESTFVVKTENILERHTNATIRRSIIQSNTEGI